jgi:hypothetical protein
MQTEHLTNLHPGWVIGGWLIAICVTAAVYLGGVGLGFVIPGRAALVWVVLAMVAGFFFGGLFVGLRWSDAPILHGTAIAFFSVLVWFLVTFFGELDTFDSTREVLGLILVQLAAAIGGARMGRRVTLGRAGAD